MFLKFECISFKIVRFKGIFLMQKTSHLERLTVLLKFECNSFKIIPFKNKFLYAENKSFKAVYSCKSYNRPLLYLKYS